MLRTKLIEAVEKYKQNKLGLEDYYLDRRRSDANPSSLYKLSQRYHFHRDSRQSVYDWFSCLATLNADFQQDEYGDIPRNEILAIQHLWGIFVDHYRLVLTEAELMALSANSTNLRKILRRYEHPADEIHMLFHIPDDMGYEQYDVQQLFNQATAMTMLDNLPRPTDLSENTVIVSVADYPGIIDKAALLQRIEQRDYSAFSPFIISVQYGNNQITSPRVPVFEDPNWEQEDDIRLPNDHVLAANGQLDPNRPRLQFDTPAIPSEWGRIGLTNKVLITGMTHLSESSYPQEKQGSNFAIHYDYKDYYCFQFNHNQNLLILAFNQDFILLEKNADGSMQIMMIDSLRNPFRNTYEMVPLIEKDACSKAISIPSHVDNVHEATWQQVDFIRRSLTMALWGLFPEGTSLLQMINPMCQHLKVSSDRVQLVKPCLPKEIPAVPEPEPELIPAAEMPPVKPSKSSSMQFFSTLEDKPDKKKKPHCCLMF